MSMTSMPSPPPSSGPRPFPEPRSGMGTGMKLFLGCLVAIGGMCVLCCGGGIIFFAMVPEGGVRLSGEMKQDAVDYLDDHNVLNDGEKVVAYYDATIFLDHTDTAILTDQRIIRHLNGNNTAIALDQVADIRHRTEPLIGDVIEVDAEDGTLIRVEIAPLQGGPPFLNALRKQVDIAGGAPAEP